MTGSVVSINIADQEGAEVRSLEEAELIVGRGIVGDRYFVDDQSEPEQQVTLIAVEEIERFNESNKLAVKAAQVRRNIVTKGVALNDLVRVEFKVGAVTLEGLELCEPCKYVAEGLVKHYSITKLSVPEIVAALVHRAGLRARIIAGGTVRPGDLIERYSDS